MPGYNHNPTSATTADDNSAYVYDTDSSDWVITKYDVVTTEWVSSSEYEISQELVGILSGNSYAKQMDRMERLEKWKQKMITIDKKQFKSHMTLKRRYYLKN